MWGVRAQRLTRTVAAEGRVGRALGWTVAGDGSSWEWRTIEKGRAWTGAVSAVGPAGSRMTTARNRKPVLAAGIAEVKAGAHSSSTEGPGISGDVGRAPPRRQLGSRRLGGGRAATRDRVTAPRITGGPAGPDEASGTADSGPARSTGDFPEDHWPALPWRAPAGPALNPWRWQAGVRAPGFLLWARDRCGLASGLGLDPPPPFAPLPRSERPRSVRAPAGPAPGGAGPGAGGPARTSSTASARAGPGPTRG